MKAHPKDANVDILIADVPNGERNRNHYLATQNVFVQLDNPKEGHLMDYLLLVGFLFRSPLGTSAIKISTFASLGCAFIYRVNNLALRTECDIALGDVDFFISILPKTYPASCNNLIHVLMDTPFGNFSIRCPLLEQYIASMSNSFVTYSSVKLFG